MEGIKSEKLNRVLGIYTKLLNGAVVNKSEEAASYGVNKRSIQRDIEEIRNFLVEESVNTGYLNSVVYDRIANGYRLERIYDSKLENGEILALCKILLDCRAFPKKELVSIIDKLIGSCVPEENRKIVKNLILNEEFHYIEPRHKTSFIDTMWKVGVAIKNNQYIEMNYFRVKDKIIV